MPAKDRTSEFYAALESLRQRQHPMMAAMGDEQRARLVRGGGGGAASDRIKSEFAMKSAAISKAMVLAAGKLEKLNKLAKRKTLFDDRPVEIQEMTHIIKQDLAGLQQDVSGLKQLRSAHLASRRHSPQEEEHTTAVMVSLQTRLAAIAAAFKEVLEMRTQNMKMQRDRREQFAGSSPSSRPLQLTESPMFMPPPSQGVTLRASRTFDASNSSSGDVAIDLGPPSGFMQQQQLALVSADTLGTERLNAVQNIEATLVELGGIFQHLSTMVAEQGEMVERIDANVVVASENIEGAQKQILEILRTTMSGRWLMVKIFAVLIFFFVIFTVFLA